MGWDQLCRAKPVLAGVFVLATLPGGASGQDPVDGRVPAPRGEIRIDGVLSPGEWAGSPDFSLDWEIFPGNATPALFETRCRALVDDRNLWFSCHALGDPSEIRAAYVPRDRIVGHDQAGLMVDPFGDGQRGYLFVVNALGVQGDGIQDARNPNGLDNTWDAVWESAAGPTEDGYVIEARVPLASLRFPPPESGGRPWGLYFMRGQPRSTNAWTYSFPADRTNGCEVCQAPRFDGFDALVPGVALDLVPYAAASSTQRHAEGGLGDPDRTGEVGVDLRWGITPGLSLNATVNPDFSQVEADVAQAEANERFALFFPERRTFFLEGAELFATPVNLFNSRQIADPDLGFKLTGALGRTTVALVGARDAVTNLLRPGVEGSSLEQLGGASTSLAGRVTRQFGESVTVGAGGTLREGDDYRNATASADLFVRPIPSLWAHGQVVRSHAEDPGAPDARRGTALRLTSRLGREHVEAFLETERIDRDFRADLGFVPQVGIRRNEGWVRALTRGSSDDPFTRLDATAGLLLVERAGGELIERQFFGRLHYEGPMTSRITLNPRNITQRWSGETFRFNQLWLFANWIPAAPVRIDLVGNVGGVVDVAESREARRWQIDPRIQARLGPHVTVEGRLTVQRLTLPGGGEEILRERVAQLRGEFAIDARTSLRLVMQNRDTRRPGSATRETLFSQLVFAWQPDALSALYVGWAEDRANDLVATSDALATELRPATRRFFLKWSRLWRP